MAVPSIFNIRIATKKTGHITVGFFHQAENRLVWQYHKTRKHYCFLDQYLGDGTHHSLGSDSDWLIVC